MTHSAAGPACQPERNAPHHQPKEQSREFIVLDDGAHCPRPGAGGIAHPRRPPPLQTHPRREHLEAPTPEKVTRTIASAVAAGVHGLLVYGTSATAADIAGANNPPIGMLADLQAGGLGAGEPAAVRPCSARAAAS
ncbi:MAG: hypothetical protein QM784_28030 [Polyangiaceae bacterium]